MPPILGPSVADGTGDALVSRREIADRDLAGARRGRRPDAGSPDEPGAPAFGSETIPQP
jgi:hypothetical protein